MACENCITENEFDPSIHKIENGPFDTQAECEDSKNSPVAFFSIDVDNPSILSEGQDLVITDLVIKLTDQNLIDSAIRQIAGLEPKKYLRGNIVDEFVWYNPEYDYHVDSNSIYFVDDIEALGNNQQDLDFYTIQAGRKLPKNSKVKSQKSPKQPPQGTQEACSACSNTEWVPGDWWGGYCKCKAGYEEQSCPTNNCSVYTFKTVNGKEKADEEKKNTVCVKNDNPLYYEWSSADPCGWVCKNGESEETCKAKRVFPGMGISEPPHTFIPERCECIPPTTCAPCPPLQKRDDPFAPCGPCECIQSVGGVSLCGNDGVMVKIPPPSANAGQCKCECVEEKACPSNKKLVAGAEHPICNCECKQDLLHPPCQPPLIQDQDDCSCNCPTGPLPVYQCTKNGQTTCVECNTNANFIYNPTTCTCECVVNCPSPKIQESPTSCNCICPAGDIQCLCSYSSTGNPDGLSSVQTMCPGDKEYIVRQDNGQCECVCKNPKTNAECGPGKVWNEQDCKCECAPNHAPCLYGQEFNQDTCECECPSVIFNEGFVSGTLDSESLQCLYEVTCYRCEECPTGRTRNLAREIIQGKSCSDFVYSGDKHYVSDCNDCETLDIVTDAVLTDPNTITATISTITNTGGAESFDEIEIELVKSNPNECCSEAVLNKTVKRTRYGYSLKSVSTTQIPTNPGTCAQQ